MEQRLEYGNDISYHTPAITHDNNAYAPEDYIEDSQTNQAIMLEHQDWKDTQQQLLSQALTTLNPREKAIIELRWLSEEKATLQALAKKLSISTERVRQLEKNAMAKVKNAMLPS